MAALFSYLRLYLTILVSNSRTKGLVYVALESCKSLIMQRAQESGGGGGHPRCPVPVRSLYQPLLFSRPLSIFQTPKEQRARAHPRRTAGRRQRIIYNWIAPSADWKHKICVPLNRYCGQVRLSNLLPFPIIIFPTRIQFLTNRMARAKGYRKGHQLDWGNKLKTGALYIYF